MVFSIILGLIVILIFAFKKSNKSENGRTQLMATPPKWKTILNEHVHFYRNLDAHQKNQFESDIQRFLGETRVTGVQTEVDLVDRLLVASSAVIPLFGFPAWNYKYLDEVLLYPSSFDRDYNIGSKTEIITGMVGTGAMEGKMILSKPAMHAGFDITNDKRNVGIHEFAHLFDKENGEVDGIPPGFEDKAYSLPWLDFVKKKTDEILANHSDIDGYGTTNRQEFFAVASEYFFERPHLLKEKHPQLYKTLSKVFHQDLTAVIDKDSYSNPKAIGRNSPCPCGSGKKYKHCCGKE
ncbi:zinc-dependent peptidase [Roseivirga seohaensis]|uniref:zinc-dependent peptidase n=1 Tax=Roseivirga seohaensis TaxID=1914963 RepID=UPI003BAD0997